LRWAGARQYWIAKLGEKLFVFSSGLIIILICPIVPIIQNIIFGLVLNMGCKFSNLGKVLKHICYGITHQTVILTETSSFNTESLPTKLIRHLFAYILYLLPPIGVLMLYLLVKTNSVGCRDMTAPFLLNNSVAPSNGYTFNEMYQRRIKLGEPRGEWGNQDQATGCCRTVPKLIRFP